MEKNNIFYNFIIMGDYFRKYFKYKMKYSELKNNNNNNFAGIDYQYYQNGGNPNVDGEIKLEWPIKALRTDKGTRLKIVAISAPFRSDKHMELYDKYHIEKNHDYQSMVKAWLYCMRDPSFISLPKILLTESDFSNPEHVKPDPKIDKIYDLVYLCNADSKENCNPGWQSHNRNWDLAIKCFEKICNEKPRRILIVGRPHCFIECKQGCISVIPFQPYYEFLNCLRKSKIIFVPNISDASPRVISESMCLDLRILVNYNIVGGWHYVNENTGEFFTDENDFVIKFDKILENYNNYRPREWFVENYGPVKSGKRLLNFLKQHYNDPLLDDAEYVTF